MNKKIILWIFVLTLLISSVSAEYYIDIYADSVNESAIGVNNIERLSYNLWRLNYSHANVEIQRAKNIELLFKDCNNSNIVQQITGINKLNTNYNIDIGRKQQCIKFQVDTIGSATLNVTFDNVVNNNVSSWSNIREPVASAADGDAVEYQMPYGNILNSVTNGNSLEIGTDTTADDQINPFSFHVIKNTRTETQQVLLLSNSNYTVYLTGNPVVYFDSVDFENNYSIPRFTLDEQMIVNFFGYYPINSTNINSDTNLSFRLLNVSGTADCDIRYNDSILESKSGLGSGIYNFSFNSSYWIEGINNFNISCTDSDETITDIKTLFVDSIDPIIVSVNDTSYGVNKNLNNLVFSTKPLINFSSKVSDLNLWSYNISVIHLNTSKRLLDFQVTNLSTIYTANHSLDLTNNVSGTISINVTIKDAHTKKDIDFSKELKDVNLYEFDKIGKIIDDKIKIKTDLKDVESFDLIENKDRKNFKLKFNKNVKTFKMYIESEKSVFYVGDKYGYGLGHFIIDDKYWYDLVNDYDAKVIDIKKISDKNYEITLIKPQDIDIITFDSIGIINTVSQVFTFDYLFSSITINIKDSNTKSLLSGINLTVQYVGTNYQDEKTTISGITEFNTRFDNSTDTVSFRMFETNNNDYSISVIQKDLIQGKNYNYTLYLTNTSNLATTKVVQIRVVDEFLERVSGAVVKIYKQDPSTNTYLELTDLTTDPNGETTFIFETYNQFYRFVVEYNGATVYTSDNPITIGDNTELITLSVTLEEPATEYITDLASIQITSDFNDIDNNSGYFDIYYKAGNSINICFNSTYIYNGVEIPVSYVCEAGTTNIKDLATISVPGFSTAKLYVNVDTGNGEGYVLIHQNSGYTGYDKAQSQNQGRLIVYLALFVLVAFGFYVYPIVGLIVLGIGVLGIYVSRFTSISFSITMYIITFIIITIISLMRKQ